MEWRFIFVLVLAYIIVLVGALVIIHEKSRSESHRNVAAVWAGTCLVLLGLTSAAAMYGLVYMDLNDIIIL
jgi:hypothetical protein